MNSNLSGATFCPNVRQGSSRLVTGGGTTPPSSISAATNMCLLLAGEKLAQTKVKTSCAVYKEGLEWTLT